MAARTSDQIGHNGGPPIEYVDIDIAEGLLPLLQPARYKAAWGGRAGAKSHFFAEQIVLRGRLECIRVACIREVQNSIKESVRQLIIDKINRFSPGEWDILEGEIRHRATGSLIIFRGMQAYNADNIKSLEGFDVVWVEEAQTLSARSLRILRPTVRKTGSEIWFSWNPRHDTDAVDVFFRGQEAPPNSIVVNVNYRDNPWLSQEIRAEIEHDYKVDPDMAVHVWEGGYEVITEGAYYARAIAALEKAGRIGHHPYDPRYRLRTSWDLGVDDYTAIWFIQDDGHRAWVVDYYETSGDGPDAIIPAALPEVLGPEALRVLEDLHGVKTVEDVMRLRATMIAERQREVPYKYERHLMPHDIMVREWGGGARERWRVLKALGIWPMGVGTQAGPVERHNAVRALLPIMSFNNTKRVQVGLSRLRRYSRKYNENLQVWEGPKKDINTHAADAFGEYAVQCGILPKVERAATADQQEPVYEAHQQADGTVNVTAGIDLMKLIEQRVKDRKRKRRST